MIKSAVWSHFAHGKLEPGVRMLTQAERIALDIRAEHAQKIAAGKARKKALLAPRRFHPEAKDG